MSVAVTPEKLGREFFEKNPRPSGRGAVSPLIHPIQAVDD